MLTGCVGVNFRKIAACSEVCLTLPRVCPTLAQCVEDAVASLVASIENYPSGDLAARLAPRDNSNVDRMCGGVNFSEILPRAAHIV